MSFIDELKSFFGPVNASGKTSEEQIRKNKENLREKSEGLGWTVEEEPVRQEPVNVAPIEERRTTLMDRVKSFAENFGGEDTWSGEGGGTQGTPTGQIVEQQEMPQVQEGTSTKYTYQEHAKVPENKQPMPIQYESTVDTASERYGVDPRDLAAVLGNEVGHTWDPALIGDDGAAYGLGQITASSFFGSSDDYSFKTSEEYGQKLISDPEYAINETARILRHKTDSNGGTPFMGVLRYNGGGDKAVAYATDAFRRMGREDEIPEEFKNWEYTLPEYTFRNGL